MCRLWVGVLAGTAVLALAAGQQAGAQGKSDPPGVPVEAKLVAKKKTYTLDLGGKTVAEFKQALKDQRYPPAPAVDLVLELRNTSDKDVKVWTSGDPVRVMLNLKGKEAVNEVLKGIALTTIFIVPKTVTLAPGKSVAIPIKSLAHGMRNASHRSYWLEPGEYTLTASLHTAVSPFPKGSKEAGEGFGRVTLTTPPIKLTVEGK
jgi:hypothetical protein